ncbi:UNVERIFIED_CONTAM: hypothetical protein NCL1_35031 [Trichonephila clavipes]
MRNSRLHQVLSLVILLHLL